MVLKLVFLALLGLKCAHSQTSQPNILFLLVDDLGMTRRSLVEKLSF